MPAKSDQKLATTYKGVNLLLDSKEQLAGIIADAIRKIENKSKPGAAPNKKSIDDLFSADKDTQVKAFLAMGTSVNWQNEKGETLAHLALENKNYPLFATLIEQPTVDLTLCDNQGRSVYDLVDQNHPHMASSLFISKKATLNSIVHYIEKSQIEEAATLINNFYKQLNYYADIAANEVLVILQKVKNQITEPDFSEFSRQALRTLSEHFTNDWHAPLKEFLKKNIKHSVSRHYTTIPLPPLVTDHSNPASYGTELSLTHGEYRKSLTHAALPLKQQTASMVANFLTNWFDKNVSAPESINQPIPEIFESIKQKYPDNFGIIFALFFYRNVKELAHKEHVELIQYLLPYVELTADTRFLLGSCYATCLGEYSRSLLTLSNALSTEEKHRESIQQQGQELERNLGHTQQERAMQLKRIENKKSGNYLPYELHALNDDLGEIDVKIKKIIADREINQSEIKAKTKTIESMVTKIKPFYYRINLMLDLFLDISPEHFVREYHSICKFNRDLSVLLHADVIKVHQYINRLHQISDMHSLDFMLTQIKPANFAKVIDLVVDEQGVKNNPLLLKLLLKADHASWNNLDRHTKSVLISRENKSHLVDTFKSGLLNKMKADTFNQTDMDNFTRTSEKHSLLGKMFSEHRNSLWNALDSYGIWHTNTATMSALEDFHTKHITPYLYWTDLGETETLPSNTKHCPA